MGGVNPQRIRLSRAKGWRLPPDTVLVSRPNRWGNPFVVSAAVIAGKMKVGATVGGHYIGVPTAEDAVECFRIWLTDDPKKLEAARADLRGKNLACWCALDEPCHADVLLELANP